MIKIQDVRKVYGRGKQSVVALDQISLEVERGEIYGVLGQSGAGKSTLIRCINALELPSSGNIEVNGQIINTLKGRELRLARQRIGMVFQHFNLLRSRTVSENIAFPLEVMGYAKARRKERVDQLLELVGMQDKTKAYPGQLSGGQKQRVGIARALAGEPDLLLSDEATSALDQQTTYSILELLSQLNRDMGLTILLITHEMGVVRQICDRVAILEKGKLVEQGFVSELAGQPTTRLSQTLFPRIEHFEASNGSVLATIHFGDKTASEPIFSTLVRQFVLDVNILGGSIETFREQRLGLLQAELKGEPEQIEAALAYLSNLGLQVEVKR